MLYAEVCPQCGEKSGEDEKHCPFCGTVKMEFVDPGDDNSSGYNPFKILSFSLTFLLIVLGLSGSYIIHPISGFLRIALILSGIASFVWGRWFAG